MRKYNQEVQELLDLLKNTNPRSIESKKIGRAAFLTEAAKIKQAVSDKAISRHKGWNNKTSWFSRTIRKETSPMYTALISAILTIVLALGGTGVTVAAAQNSNSNDFLYPVKLFSEDMRLRLTADPSAELQLQADYLIRRTTELYQIVTDGESVPPQLMTRIQEQVTTMLQQAFQSTDPDANLVMEQIQAQVQLQLQLMQQLNGNQENALLLQTRTRLEEQSRLMEAALSDPLMNREQLQQQLQQQIQQQTQQQTQQQLQEQQQINQPQNTGTPQWEPTGTMGQQNQDGGSGIMTPAPPNSFESGGGSNTSIGNGGHQP